MQRLVPEVAVMVKQQIEKSGMVGMLPGGIVMTGGGSLLPGADKLFSDILKLGRVRVGEPHVQGPHSSSLNQAGMATVVGLAQFAIQFANDELAPAESGSWKDRIRTLWSALGGKEA